MALIPGSLSECGRRCPSGDTEPESFAMRTTLFMLILATLVGCSAHATQAQLLRRAAFDLECPEAEIETVQIDDRTVGVKACGKRATYLETCESGANKHGTYRRNCTWVMNTDVRGAGD